MKIPLFKPWLLPKDRSSIIEAIKTGWLGMGVYVAELEKVLPKVTDDSRNAVCLNTGHSALHLALLAKGVGCGDEVITPSLNHVADFQAIKATGASIVFCDVNPETLTACPDSICQLISDRTKVILPIDYAGYRCNLSNICDVANKRKGISVVHDASHSFGSLPSLDQSLQRIVTTMYSFDAVKTVTAIDGGALMVTSNEEQEFVMSARVLGTTQSSARMYSHTRPETYDVTQVGFRYHLCNSHAAIALSQLERIEEIRVSRINAVSRVKLALSTANGIEVVSSPYENVVQATLVVRVKGGGRRDQLAVALNRDGIETGIHWPPGHQFLMFRSAKRGCLRVTDSVCEELVSLPLHTMMENCDLEAICDAVVHYSKRI